MPQANKQEALNAAENLLAALPAGYHLSARSGAIKHLHLRVPASIGRKLDRIARARYPDRRRGALTLVALEALAGFVAQAEEPARRHA